jgi:hypothetical protein
MLHSRSIWWRPRWFQPVSTVYPYSSRVRSGHLDARAEEELTRRVRFYGLVDLEEQQAIDLYATEAEALRVLADIVGDEPEWAKPTPGLDPGTPSLRVKSSALAGCAPEWLEVAA